MPIPLFRNLPIAAAITVVSAPVMAAIIGVLPDIVYQVPPSVILDATQSDTEILGFDEQQCITLSHDLKTDQGDIQEGTPLSCHFFHSDPLTSSVLVGRARFDAPIIGVISTSTGLDESDGDCRLPGVDYPSDNGFGSEMFRGLEAFQPNDYYRIPNNRMAIEISADVPSDSDQVRVITRCYEWEEWPQQD